MLNLKQFMKYNLTPESADKTYHCLGAYTATSTVGESKVNNTLFSKAQLFQPFQHLKDFGVLAGNS